MDSRCGALTRGWPWKGSAWGASWSAIKNRMFVALAMIVLSPGFREPQLFQLGEILGPELVLRPRPLLPGAVAILLAPAQVDAPDLAGDGLGELRELQPP